MSEVTVSEPGIVTAWVSVEDRLPEPADLHVLVAWHIPYDHPLVRRVEEMSWSAVEEYIEPEREGGAYITHWMPMPEPPSKPTDPA